LTQEDLITKIGRIYTNHGAKSKGRDIIAGYIDGDIFYKDIRKKSQRSYRREGFGIDLTVLAKLRTRKINSIIFKGRKQNYGITFQK